MPYTNDSLLAFVELASFWHGGQWSDLYSFASTGGKIHSKTHANGLIAEIEEDIRLAHNDKPQLEEFKQAVEAALEVMPDDPQTVEQYAQERAEWGYMVAMIDPQRDGYIMFHDVRESTLYADKIVTIVPNSPSATIMDGRYELRLWNANNVSEWTHWK